MYSLRLYVSGLGPGAQRQIAGVRALLDDTCPGAYELAVFDIFDDPVQAREDTVYATPTLLRLWPPPPSRLIGDLSDPKRVAAALALSASG